MPKNAQSEELTRLIKEGLKPSEIAKILNIKSHTVHNRIHYLRTKGQLKQVPAVRKAATETVAANGVPDATITLAVKADDVIEIKLRNPDLQGTLLVSKYGVAYKRPNQKLKPETALPFETLAKILETELFSGK